MTKRKSWFCIFFFLAAGIFHILTLNFPPPDGDDVALVDIAAHGRLMLWEHILPPANHFILNTFGPIFPASIYFSHWILKTFGIGIAQVRLLTFLPAWMALGLLLWMLTKLDFKDWDILPVLLILATFPFFHITHRIRQEGLLLLVMQLNIAWLFLNGGPYLGFFCGLLATAIFSIHPAIVLLLGLWPIMIFVRDGRDSIKNPRHLWWMVGASIGIFYVLRAADMDTAMQYLKLAKASGVHAPPLFYLKGNIWQMIYDKIQLSLSSVDQNNPWYAPVWALFLSSAVWLWRRLNSLSNPERWILSLGTFLFIIMALFNSSSHEFSYDLYLLPWIFLTIGIVFRKSLYEDLYLDYTDQLCFIFFNVLTLSMLCTLSSYLILFSFLIRILLGGAQQKPSRVTTLILALICLTLVTNIQFLQIAGSLVLYLFKHRPFVSWFWLLMPWVLLKTGPTRLEFRRFIKAPPQLLYMGLLYSLFMIKDSQLIYEAIRYSQPGPRWETCLASMRKEPRLVGPGALWLYAPEISLQSISALYYAKCEIPRFEMPYALIQYHPSLILWPAEDQKSLEHAFSESHAKRVTRKWGTIWKTPFGDFQELRLQNTESISFLRRK